MTDRNLLHRFGEWIKRYFSRRDAVVFGVAFAAALLIHLFGFVDKFINHDDVDGLYSDCGFALASGRWFLQIVHSLVGNVSSSWLNGLMGSFSLAAAAMLVVKMFRFRRLFTAVLLSICMIAFPTVASTYAYMFSSGAYLFAMLLAVAGVWLVRQEKLSAWIAGAVLLALSMGCYQAYFCLAAVLLVVLLIYDLCTNRWQGAFKPLFLTALKYLGALVLGLVSYYVILRILLAATGTVLTDYQGISGMGNLTVPLLLQRIETAYQSYCDFLGDRLFGMFNGYFPFLAYASAVIGLGTVVFCVVKQRLWRQWVTMVFLALLVGVFPLASCLIYLMTDVNIHLLMLYPMVVTLLLPCFAIEHLKLPAGAWLQRGTAVLGAGLILLQSLTAYEMVKVTNHAYFAMDITYENVYAYYLKLSAKIELTEGWVEDTPIALLGTATMDNYVPDPKMTGVLVGDAALNIYSFDRIFSYYMGTTYRYATPEQREAIVQKEAYQAMPCYPDAGSIAVIDGVVAIKLSE